MAVLDGHPCGPPLPLVETDLRDEQPEDTPAGQPRLTPSCSCPGSSHLTTFPNDDGSDELVMARGRQLDGVAALGACSRGAVIDVDLSRVEPRPAGEGSLRDQTQGGDDTRSAALRDLRAHHDVRHAPRPAAG